MKCQILFSGKNKKNNIILSSAENAQRVVKVKGLSFPPINILYRKHGMHEYTAILTEQQECTSCILQKFIAEKHKVHLQ